MKKSLARLILVGMLAMIGIGFVAMPALAQTEPTTVTVFGVEVDPVTLFGIVAIVGGGIVSVIVQIVKKKIAFFAEGVGAFIFSVIMSLGVTAIWFGILHPMSPWIWPKFIVYGVCVIGEATGTFHLIKKITNTPSTPAA